MIWIFDVSNHNGVIDFSRAKREGYSAVWIKATEGTTYRDALFDGFAEQAKAAGLVPGAYHFLRAGDGRTQCDRFHARIRDHGGPEGWLAACDNEVDASWETTRAFFARWGELAPGHPLFMYSSNWWWESRGWSGSSLTPLLWDSRYVGGAGFGSKLYSSVPNSWWTPRYGGWGTVTVLQFSDKATVAGASPVDVDAFPGTIDELRALTRAGGDIDMQQSEPLAIDTGVAGRTIANHFADLQDLRGWLMGETVSAAHVPPASSPLGRLLAAADLMVSGGGMTDDQVGAVADRIATALVARGDNTLGEEYKPVIREAVGEALREVFASLGS